MGLIMYKKWSSHEFINFDEVALYNFLVDCKPRHEIYFKKMKGQLIDGSDFMMQRKDPGNHKSCKIESLLIRLSGFTQVTKLGYGLLSRGIIGHTSKIFLIFDL
jgi:hypothetical protein